MLVDVDVDSLANRLEVDNDSLVEVDSLSATDNESDSLADIDVLTDANSLFNLFEVDTESLVEVEALVDNDSKSESLSDIDVLTDLATLTTLLDVDVLVDSLARRAEVDSDSLTDVDFAVLKLSDFSID
ncbi:hypothetical protein [Staphylococcus schleiferi]|uniref:hypothetical protein n=1 Tax=Staphylococcus schleiferi TaxID=1295 RepID=UPI001F61904E|nr:hypothetical protein [Staphylococcus schleiferi]NHA39648.1 hypothetical protein [Staphylococcus schleiferi]NHA41648.1 hypothetical protein [Staphylococcus schleiferi]UXR55197.1 hypothetical protein MUA46_01190 [Staphylococcus schleiferi]UXR57505.1 hypothetical protein MUA40_01195 [Staphylococcus schleiferi]UXR59791.1 hypothetical protein MUA91_01195 [Staphylococcus schleiferi]